MNRKLLLRWGILLSICIAASLGAAWYLTSDNYTGRIKPGSGEARRGSPPKPQTPIKSEAIRSSKAPGAPGDPAADWPQFLGRDRDNRSRETGLLDEWPEKGPQRLWSVNGLGSGYSSVAVSRGVIYTMGTADVLEYVMALNADDGGEIWRTPVDHKLLDGTGDGPRSTPSVDGDRVYALGANGGLACLNSASGDLIWKKNILVDFGGNQVGWGICESVLIDGDRVICTPGGPKAVIVALDKSTGDTLWKSEIPEGSNIGYSSVIPAEFGGVRQYVQFLHHGVVGVRASDGKRLWSDSSSSSGMANCTSPLVVDDMVFTSSGYGKGGAMLKLASQSTDQTTKATLGYFTEDIKTHHGGMVCLDGYVYASSDPGALVCLDLKGGKVKWRSRSPSKGSVTAADGKLLIRSESGKVTYVKADPERYQELGQFEPGEGSGRQTWAYPVVAQGRLFLRDQERLQCYQLKK